MTASVPWIIGNQSNTAPVAVSKFDDNFNSLIAAINAITVTTGQAINAQTGVTYAVVAGDLGKLLTFTNAGAIAVSIPQAIGSFAVPWFADFTCLKSSAGSVTITPTTSTIDGVSTFMLPPGSSIRVVSDGTNYQIARGNGKILQIVQVQKTTTFTTANVAYTDVTGVAATIVPTSATSVILVLCSGMISNTVTANGAYAQIIRAATPINIGATSGSKTSASAGKDEAITNGGALQLGIMCVDSPATGASTTYKLQIRAGTAGTAQIGMTGADVDNADSGRYPTNLILIEFGP